MSIDRDYLGPCRHFYQEHFFNQFGVPKGVREEEIIDLEKRLGFPVPHAHRLFLLWMGQDVSGPFRGIDIFASDVLENTNYFAEFAREINLELEWERNPVCFSSSQGCYLSWYYASPPNQNPDCFGVSDSKPSVVQDLGAFANVILSGLQSSAKIL